MYLEEITGEIILESSKIECKSVLNRKDVVGWLKTIAGFANAFGGDFYIGVEDKSNKLIGFDKKNADNERNYFNNQVNEHLVPRPQMSISFIPYNVRSNVRYLIKVHVPESSIKPVILKYDNIPSIFMRRDGFTNGATYEEIIEMSIKSQNNQYDIMVSNVQYDFSKLSKLCAFYKKYTEGKDLKEKALRSMGFVTENNYLLNGAVLFLDDYKEGKTEIMCSVFSGLNKGSQKIVTVNRFNGNITETIEYIIEFVTQRMNHTIIKKDNNRQNVDAFPQRALFEGVINAVVHRDYYLNGTQIQIDMYKDRLEISSPGGFYRGEKFGKTYDLSGIISKRRNELISNVLVACNVMEASGSGFDKISEEYASADENHKPYIYSSSDHFTLVLPDLTYDNGIRSDDIPAISFFPLQNGTEYDENVLAYCYCQKRKVSDIAKYIGKSDSTYLRKEILENLVKNGYLIKTKEARAHYYLTNKDVVSIE
ncbi:MAG: putative DNA binding domain-containing protein [Lachnospiraceae bacterium]|nr:putative DNA binding domain-containing protein [Lachnospiraceae bacterium]